MKKQVYLLMLLVLVINQATATKIGLFGEGVFNDDYSKLIRSSSMDNARVQILDKYYNNSVVFGSWYFEIGPEIYAGFGEGPMCVVDFPNKMYYSEKNKKVEVFKEIPVDIVIRFPSKKNEITKVFVERVDITNINDGSALVKIIYNIEGLDEKDNENVGDCKYWEMDEKISPPNLVIFYDQNHTVSYLSENSEYISAKKNWILFLLENDSLAGVVPIANTPYYSSFGTLINSKKMNGKHELEFKIENVGVKESFEFSLFFPYKIISFQDKIGTIVSSDGDKYSLNKKVIFPNFGQGDIFVTKELDKKIKNVDFDWTVNSDSISTFDEYISINFEIKKDPWYKQKEFKWTIIAMIISSIGTIIWWLFLKLKLFEKEF